tara:strand:- start:62 stop:1084 length:1023 start_codon:yes stop_codon:yes gene_type:complete
MMSASLLLMGCSKNNNSKDSAALADSKSEAPQESSPQCLAPLTLKPVKTFTAGERSYEFKGSVLNALYKDGDQTFVIGHLSDLKDAKKANIANLKLFSQWFLSKKVDAVVVTGDLGDDQENIESSLNAIAEVIQVPILAIIGNGECKTSFNDALASLNQKHPHVINMNLTRVFNADDASIVSLPGYYNPTFIHCTDGCRYFPSDVERLDTFVQHAPHKSRVLISHGPPRMSGAGAIDRLLGGNNVGDKALAAFLKKKNHFPFGLFGNIQEAGGRASNLEGKAIQPETLTKELYVNAGSANAVRMPLLDGTESIGMAAILTIEGDKALYETKRIPNEPAAE